MNTDLSVAPEIALLAAPIVPAQTDAPRPRTDGRLAGDLADLAAAPQRWWDLVRFDPEGPLRIPVPGSPGAWLLVMPPGAAAECDCDQATALAGEAVETSGPGGTGTARPLRPGRVLVHGTRAPHRLLSAGHGYRSRSTPQSRRSVRKYSKALSRTDRKLHAVPQRLLSPGAASARGDLSPEEYPIIITSADAPSNAGRPQWGPSHP